MTKWTLTLFAVLCILAGWLYSRRYPFRLAELRFEHEVSREIRDSVFQNLSPYFGQSIYSFSLEEIKIKVEKNPLIAEAQVRRRWPATLYLDLTPRQIVGIAQVESRFWTFDERGQPILALTEPVVAPFLKIENSMELTKVEESLRTKLGRFALYLKSNSKTKINWRDINEISYEANKGFFIISRSANLEVDLGFDSPEFAWDRAMKAYANLLSKKLQVTHLDAAYQKRVVARLQNSQNTLELNEIVRRKNPHVVGDGGQQPHEIR